MKTLSLATLLFILLHPELPSLGLPAIIEKKVIREVERTFDITEFSMETVAVPAELNKELPVKITADNLFKLVAGTSEIGYAFVEKAPSKTASFDFLVLLDMDLKIIHSKVLIYREEYGGEIGSNRWLKQFLGKTGNDRVSPDTNIDAIAGATISVRSMTRSMDNFLQTIGILHDQKVL